MSLWRIKAEQALVESIEHWKRMASDTQAKDEYPAARSCACCRAFIADGDCVECPIALRAGADGCKDTPYEDAWDAFYDRAAGENYVQAALDAEVRYLKQTLEMVRSGELKPEEGD